MTNEGKYLLIFLSSTFTLSPSFTLSLSAGVSTLEIGMEEFKIQKSIVGGIGFVSSSKMEMENKLSVLKMEMENKLLVLKMQVKVYIDKN